jgi:hypothetical protein
VDGVDAAEEAGLHPLAREADALGGAALVAICVTTPASAAAARRARTSVMQRQSGFSM